MIDYGTLVPKVGPSENISLVPEQDLYFSDRGVWWADQHWNTPQKTINKFVRCFQKTWRRIPESDQLQLMKYWRPSEVNSIGQPRLPEDHPIIALSDGERSLQNRKACCSGYSLLFSIWWVDFDKPTIVSNVIAHELGHAMSHVHDWFTQHRCDLLDITCEECLACECRAHSYMASWGFDPFLGDLPKRKRIAERFAAASK